MDEEIRVVVAADAGYTIPLAAMVRSVLDQHRGVRLTVRVLTRGMTSQDEARLIESWPTPDGVRVELHPIDHVTFGRLVGFNGITVTTYTRLLLAELLPADWTRVIYLDADTVVCSDLRPLWRYPLDCAVLGAVQDDGVPYVSSPKGVQEWRELGLHATQRFFNAGVMIIDLRRWRDLEIGTRALAYAQQRADRRVVCDQEALNAVVAGLWQPLPEEWNIAALRHAEHAVLARQGVAVPPCRIRHFTTRDKPWTPGAPLGDAELFFGHLDRTAWAGWRPDTTATAAVPPSSTGHTRLGPGAGQPELDLPDSDPKPGAASVVGG